MELIAIAKQKALHPFESQTSPFFPGPKKDWTKNGPFSK
jgi:hypothetical protein